MATNSAQERFLTGSAGKFLDPDGVYRYQCVDVAIAYAMACFPDKNWERDTFGRGNANMHFPKNNGYWDSINNIPGDVNSIPQRGDIVIWAGDAYNPFGHIAVVLQADAHQVVVLQQNADGSGNLPVEVASLPYIRDGLGYLVGWLRPRVKPDAPAKPNQRRAGNYVVNTREQPRLGAKVTREIPPNSLEEFDGYVHGDLVDLGGGVKADLWFKDRHGYTSVLFFDPTNVNGLPDLTPKALAKDQRLVGPAGAIQRDAPRKAGKEIRRIAGNTVEAFLGYVRGEKVSSGGVTTDLWYADKDGYVWAGGFTEQKTDGLKELAQTPAKPVLAANQRLVGHSGAIQRKDALTASGEVRRIAGDTVETFTHWVAGEKVTLGGVTSDLWYKDSQGFVWAGAFTEQKKDGLQEFTAATLTPTKPAIPAEPEYAFKASVPCVTEVIPAALDKFQRGGMPVAQKDLVVHQFIAGETKLDTHISSVIATFTGGDRVASAHFAVEGKRVIQFVDLSDRAYHAGPGGNDFWSIEVYPGMDGETLATLGKLIRELEALAGTKLKLRKHMDIMATRCGEDVDLERIDAVAHPVSMDIPTVIAPPVFIPTPAPAAPEVTTPVDLDAERVLLTRYALWQIDNYLNGRK